MLNMFFFVLLFWCLIRLTNSDNVKCSENDYSDKNVAPRGYYAGVGYPYLPFLEPLTILAVLAFLAFLIQTFHAVYHYHNHGLLGGLLDNVLPNRNRELSSETGQNEEILKAIEFYELIQRRRKKKKKGKTPTNERKQYIPLTVKTPDKKSST